MTRTTTAAVCDSCIVVVYVGGLSVSVCVWVCVCVCACVCAGCYVFIVRCVE